MVLYPLLACTFRIPGPKIEYMLLNISDVKSEEVAVRI